MTTTTLIAHDPALVEAAAADGGELSVIVRLAEGQSPPAGTRIVTRFGDIATLRVQPEQLAELAERESIVAIERSRRLHAVDRVDAASLDEPAAVAYARRPDGVHATGRGVVVAALDWGIDVAHPAFRKPDGATRLLALWDQRGREASGQGNRWGYGRIHHAEAIDAALRTDNPYAALGYHPGDADERDAESGEWKGAHGTHVCDIAAGNGAGGGMVGVAPDADLVFVHLAHTTRALGPGNLGDSAALLEALDFVFEIAGARPCVVNMSVGAHGGPHDGTTLCEQGIDQAVWLLSSRAAVNSAGNYFDARAHAHGRIRAGEEAVLHFDVPGTDRSDSEIEVYYESPDRFTATVADGRGTVLATLDPGQDAPLVVDGRPIGHVYHHVREATNGDRHIDMFLRPGAPSGTWTIRLKAITVEDGRYHAWIERERGPRPKFTHDSVDVYSTTGTLCNGRHAITVGAYDPHHAGRPMGRFSSSGPTRDGRMKPEIVAPGVDIVAGRSTPPHEHPAARYTSKGGTSMAAPHVTGTVALMFEAAGRPMDIADTRALLFSSTDCGPARPDMLDLHRRGYGYLDTAAAERAARSWGGRSREPEEAAMDAQPETPVTEAAIAEEVATLPEVAAQAPIVEDTRPPAVNESAVEAMIAEEISIDDVAVEMNGQRALLPHEYPASRPDGARRTFSAGALLLVGDWNGNTALATIDGFPVPKALLAPATERVAGMRYYRVGLDAQRNAIARNAAALRDWRGREAEYRTHHGAWESERARLEDLLSRRQVTYSRMWVKETMYNRFDTTIAAWTSHYNRQLSPATALDPAIVKSMLYQESRLGTSGQHLMPPPSDWTSSDRHPIRSRFNLGQAIDSWGPQQWLMMREMAPALFARHGLDALAAAGRWLSMTNAQYGAHATFVRAMQEFFEYRNGTRNLMGTENRDLHEDYGFWIRTAIRWLFQKYSGLRTPDWAEAVRAYNGSGPHAQRYRQQVMARVGSTDAFDAESIAADAAEDDPPRIARGTPRPPQLDTSARLEWVDMDRVPDRHGVPRVVYVTTGAPRGRALPGREGHAVFHLKVTNTNSVYNHQDVVTKHRLLHAQPDGQFREAMPWTSSRGQELEDETSRVIEIALSPRTLAAAYDPDWPWARVESEYHWREAGEGFQKHVNRTGLDFMLVAPIEMMFSGKQRIHSRDIEFNDPARDKDDFWIPLTGVQFSELVRQPVTIQLDVGTTVNAGGTTQRTSATSQTTTASRVLTTARTFSLQLSGEVSQGGKASATIEVLQAGVESMMKRGFSMGYSRTSTDASSLAVAREISQSLMVSRSYALTQALTTRTSITVSPPEVLPPRGSGRGAAPDTRAVGIGSVGVYLYPLVAFFRVQAVRFLDVNRFGQATRRSDETFVIPYITEWRMIAHRGT